MRQSSPQFDRNMRNMQGRGVRQAPQENTHFAPRKSSKDLKRQMGRLSKAQMSTISASKIIYMVHKFLLRNIYAVVLFVSLLTSIYVLGGSLFQTSDGSNKTISPVMWVTLSYIIALMSAFFGLLLSKRLLLSQQDCLKTPSGQGSGVYMIFAFISVTAACICSVMGYAMAVTLKWPEISHSIFFMVASVFFAYYIAKYGFILPATSANCRTSMNIAARQSEPLMQRIFPLIVLCKIIPIISSVMLSQLYSGWILYALTGLVSSLSMLSIYLILAVAYAAAGYLLSSEFAVNQSAFIRGRV
ncbi:MAG: hypothetical protein AAF621_02905 [Pseudomonadota bacterium]